MLTSTVPLVPHEVAYRSKQHLGDHTPDLAACLDRTAAELRLADPQTARHALSDLFGTLRDFKLCSSEEAWKEIVAVCRSHPLQRLIHQDPFTYRAFSKPRGYAGDAVMLDYIYGREENWDAPKTSAVGAQVFDYTTQAPASEGVRARRGDIAALIDRLAEETPRPDVLAIACGHLREAMLCRALKRRKLGRFVGLDADELSLGNVERELTPFGVETAHADIRQLLRGKVSLGKFDLVYSTGLFDYLNESTGRRLVSRMFDLTKPGGEVVVANFLPGVHDVGYMEAFMNWNLIYRNRRDMVNLTMNIPEEEIADVRIFSEENQNIIFLRVTKKREHESRSC